MVLRITHLLGILLAAISIGAPAALGQADPGEITRNAIAAMQQVTGNTIDDIQAAAARGIAVIQQLDADGATDEQLIRAAHRAVQAVHHEAAQGNRHINLIANRAAQALRALDADRQFFAAVHQAAQRSHEAIGNAAQRGVNAIRVALQEALDG